MTKVNKIDKNTLRLIGLDMQAAVQEVAAKYGITASYTGGSYSDLAGTIKIDIAATSESGDTQEALDFKRLARQFGMEASDLGRTFTVQGKTLRISGLITKRTAKPVMALMGDDPKPYVFTVEDVCRLLGKTPREVKFSDFDIPTVG